MTQLKKILAIDDQKDNLITITAVLKSQMKNCSVITAISGNEGIKLAINEQPDVILLDIIMPQMDGYAVCEMLKKNEQTKHIPVILITAIKTDSKSRVKGLNIGADAFLSKPIDAIELTAQVNVMLRIKEAEDKLRAEKVDLEKLVSERTMQLQISNEKYYALYENAPIPYQSLNEDGTVKDINPAWLNTLGYERDEVIGKNYKDFLHPGSKEHFEINFPVFKKNGCMHDVQFKIKHKNGHYLDISFEGCIGYYPDGSFRQTYCVFQDITKRIAVEQEVKKLTRAVTQSPSIIVIADTNGNIEYANPKFSELTGYAANEVIGKNPRILKSGEQNKKIYENLWKTITSGKEWRGEFHNKKKNGELFWETANISPIFDSKGVITNFIKVSKDITEQKRAEQIQKVLYNISEAVATTDNLEQLIRTVQSELGGIINTDNFYVALCNEKTKKLSLAYLSDQLETRTYLPEGKTLTNYVLSTQKPLFGTKEKLKELESSNEIEKHGPGSEIWLGVPLKIENKVIGVLVVQNYENPKAYSKADLELLELVSYQISISIDRKTKEERIKESEERYRSLVNNLPVGVFRSTVEGKVLSVNPEMLKIYGYSTQEELLSVPAQNYYSNKEARKIMLDTLDKYGVILEHETLENKKDGSKIWVSTNYIKTYNEKEGTHFIDGVVIDITERKKADDKLKEALHKAKESDRLKSAFLANMSHEIRTPMNGILGFSELLKNPELSGEQQKSYIEIIEKSGKRMLNIINDIVDISKIEAGMMKIVKNTTNINEQIASIFEFFRNEANAKNIEIEYQTSLPNKQAVIETDAEKLYAIFTNLVKNAIKYSDSGKIVIGYDLIQKTNMLQFYVRDNGIGIPKERLNAIFERFIQADIGDKRAFQGAGLGLAITKAYVEALEGKIWVESTEGKGSEFYFTLPYNSHQDTSSLQIVQKDDSPKTDQLKILVAEDDEPSEQLIRIAIQPLCNEILVAENGVKAVDICKDNPDIDMIIMDIQMPVIDGYEATRLIREFNKNVVIIAHTAYALSGDRDTALKAGCNDYIAKPVNAKDLRNLLKKYSLEKIKE